MTVKQLEEIIIELIEEYAETDEITKETSLVQDLCLSSMQVLSFVADMEDEFGIEIKPTELSGIVTVNDIINMVIGLLS